MGGYRATSLGEWETSAPLPWAMKQTINRAELVAVIAVVQQFGTLDREIAVAVESEYVYAGLQGSAHWSQQNGWVSAAGPVSNADLWIQPWDLIASSTAIVDWIKIPSHTGLHGNDVADQLANHGPLSSSLYHSSRRPPPACVGPG